MPRYVILEHDTPQGLHWDVMLQWGEVLRTWAAPDLPDSKLTLNVRDLPDHRAAYLDYEGPVSGGRGSVSRWDQGTYEIVQQSDTRLVVELSGQRMTGRAVLQRGEAADAWQWRFQPRA
jgi:hypothetical protein